MQHPAGRRQEDLAVPRVRRREAQDRRQRPGMGRPPPQAPGGLQSRSSRPLQRTLRDPITRPMADDKFDSIVVGAGPAGVSAAITMARAGLSVALLERGEYPGAKNVQGAVLYSKMLQDIIPEFWKDCPLERAIVEERVLVLTEKAGIQVGYKSAEYDTEPANCYTIVRTPF